MGYLQSTYVQNFKPLHQPLRLQSKIQQKYNSMFNSKIGFRPKTPLKGLRLKEINNKSCNACAMVHLYPILSHLVKPGGHNLKYEEITTHFLFDTFAISYIMTSWHDQLAWNWVQMHLSKCLARFINISFNSEAFYRCFWA